jgi:hypothetical protein
LHVVRGWVGKPTISYPKEFWQGLGLRRSNVTTLPPISSAADSWDASGVRSSRQTETSGARSRRARADSPPAE